MSQSIIKEFDFTQELHKTIIHSLTTSFGLDFLLFEDKKGGNVDTIHNVRQGIYSTQAEQDHYDNKTEYNSQQYHSHNNYIAKGRKDKELQQANQLQDNYRDKMMKQSEERQLDHTISAHEIHHDAGRVLAELNGVELANQDTNLNSTAAYINNAKKEHSVEHCINHIFPERIKSKQLNIARNQEKLKTMPSDTPQQRNEKQKIEDQIRKDQEHINDLNSIDKKAMLNADKEARKNYNRQINSAYYSSSKFLKNTTFDSAKSGVTMGTRQALGLVLAEVWFELKEQIPQIYQRNRNQFDFDNFLTDIKKTLVAIWDRVSERFQEILITFKDSTIGGALSSLTTTLLNIFTTTASIIGKLIRESWNALVKLAKLIFFNPDKLSLGDLCREAIRLLTTSISLTLGVMLNQHLNATLVFPFGSEIAAFLSALATGVMAIGFSYFLDHSALMQKVWNYLNRLKSKYQHQLEYYQKVNAELDRYLTELAKIEFNMNPDELSMFADNLAITNSEYERGELLAREIERQNIDLPFKTNDLDSTRDWLKTL